MPCVFMYNWEDNRIGFHPDFVDKDVMNKLIKEIAEVAGVLPEEVQIHFPKGKYLVYTYKSNAQVLYHGIHARIDWHEGRDDKTKMQVANAIFQFCRVLGIEKGLDITFNDYPKGSSFIIEVDGNLLLVGGPSEKL